MYNNITNYFDNNNVDLGKKLVSKDYLLTYYPDIANSITTPELLSIGNGFYGQLGDNTSTNKTFPVATFSGGANWKQVSCGYYHAAAIKTDGTLWTWGLNDYMPLGLNTNNGIKSTPVTTFAGGTDWKQVSCAYRRTAAIKTDGTLWTWGRNSYGTLGNNNTINSSTPVTTFAGGTDWKLVGCGYRHIAAIKNDGTLWTWGANGSGQLGDNTIITRSTPVTTFSGGSNWKQVSCGYFHTAAIKTDGTLWTWGSGGSLGDNTTINKSTPVTTFAGGTNWKQVSCGDDHTLAIKTDGTLWAWGSNNNGQIGNNTTNWVYTPVTTFSGGTNWKQVSGGRTTSAAIKTDGTLWVWGRNLNAQFSINDSNNRLTPITTFASGNNWKQVATGGYTVSAIRSIDVI